MFDYLKFLLFYAVAAVAIAAIFAGGMWMPLALASLIGYYVIGDAILGDDTSTPKYRFPGLLTFQLWMTLPILSVVVFAMVWSVSPTDFGGVGQWIYSVTGYDVLAARDATNWAQRTGGIVLTGLMIAVMGTLVGHELTHRTWDPISMFFGRWNLAYSFDTSFAVEHVYGHHRYVSTVNDPATAPRGRNVYYHVIASTIKGNISAWKLEKQRLQREGKAVFSASNSVIRGYLMSAALVATAYHIGGATGALVFTACGVWGKALLEIVNYMEHYGMVRNPNLPVQPRHSWNTTKRVSSWTMFNLTRHSHHHAHGEVPFQDLAPMPDAPKMLGGYLTTILVAMCPPLWHKLMTPKVLEWDRVYASPEEKELIKKANAASGVRAFMNAVKA